MVEGDDGVLCKGVTGLLEAGTEGNVLVTKGHAGPAGRAGGESSVLGQGAALGWLVLSSTLRGDTGQKASFKVKKMSCF